MTNRGLSARDRFLLIFLVVILIGVCYYLFFYKPLQADLQHIATQSSETDLLIQTSMAKVSSMDGMQKELDEIFSRPESEITEIAPFDNAKVVMSQLNGILSASDNYSLNFKDPDIQADGTVRRVVTMSFDCSDYASAKAIIHALSSSHWRCLINGIAVNSMAKDLDSPKVPAVPAETEEATGAENGETTGAENGETAETELEPGVMNGPITIQATITFFESTNISR